MIQNNISKKESIKSIVRSIWVLLNDKSYYSISPNFIMKKLNILHRKELNVYLDLIERV
mgnify:CR=1 FL=1